MTTLKNLSWITGATYGLIVTWEQAAQSFITVLTSLVITLATFFLTRYLSKKYPNRK